MMGQVSEEISKDEYSKLVYQDKNTSGLRNNPDVRIISNIGGVYVVIMKGKL